MHSQRLNCKDKFWSAPVALRIIITSAFLFTTLQAFSQTSIPQKPIQLPIAIAGKITFPATLIPKLPPSLPTVKLTSQAPPEAFLRDTLSKTGSDLTTIKPIASTSLRMLQAAPQQVLGLVEQDHLTAFWDTQTGAAEIFPKLDKLKPVQFAGAQDTHLTQALTIARQVFARPEIIPKDVTQYTLGDTRPVLGSTAQQQAGAVATAPKVSPAQLYLTYVALSRSVNGYRVYGTGSHAAIAVGPEGNVQALVSRWKVGSFSTTVAETRTPAQIQSALTALLKPYTANSNVEVLSVALVYYDDGGAAMPPLYRIVSCLHPLSARGITPALLNDTDYAVNYLAYGNGQLPAELMPGAGPAPADSPKQGEVVVQKPVAADDPTVGMYVVRDAPSGSNPSDGFVAEANGFWDGLQSSHAASQFTKAQYYWAQPWMYNSSEASFVNSVNVALTEAHGAPWLFTTESNCCDTVNINTIPASQGYGAANHGKLAYWIIHSCEVVPSAQDNAAWWTPWFKVFQGLHAVMGSRTNMYFDSGAVNKPFGQNIGNGAAVVPAWFNATLSYVPASTQPPVDRPSAVTVCGHEPDTVFNTSALPAASCLTNYWQPN